MTRSWGVELPRKFDSTVIFRLDRPTREALGLMAREREATVGRLLRAMVTAELGRWETPARLRDRAKIPEEEVR